jgi:toxin CcdB
MAQFDVYRNLSRARVIIPFVLVIQRERYDDNRYRVVVPLILRTELRAIDKSLNPAFTIEGREVVMDPIQTASIPVASLGPKVDNLAKSNSIIVRAIDELTAPGK